jgi:hypothetical protein
MSFTERAARGAARFDQVRPGWSSGINPGTVDVRSLNRCPAGQVFGSFSVALKELGINGQDQETIVELGLDVHPHESTRNGYAALSAAWESEINERVNRR